MLIPYKNIDGKNIANAEVEIPDQVLNHFAISVNDTQCTLNLPHIRPGSFTRIMGNAPLRFSEESDKLIIPYKEHKGIHFNFPNVDVIDVNKIFDLCVKQGILVYNNTKDLLTTLGFQERGAARYWHPALGDDTMINWINFDVNTDHISTLIFKTFNKGWQQRGIKSRTLVKKALNDI